MVLVAKIITKCLLNDRRRRFVFEKLHNYITNGPPLAKWFEIWYFWNPGECVMNTRPSPLKNVTHLICVHVFCFIVALNSVWHKWNTTDIGTCFDFIYNLPYFVFTLIVILSTKITKSWVNSLCRRFLSENSSKNYVKNKIARHRQKI